MGQFGVAAILAALCPSLCLYGSSNSGGDLKYAARNKLDNTLGLERWVHWTVCCLRVSRFSIDSLFVKFSGSGDSTGSLSCSQLVATPEVAEYGNYQVKPIYKELSRLVFVVLLTASRTGGTSRSRLARPSIPRLSVRPFPYTACVTAGRAAAMRSGGYDTRTSGEPTTTSPRSATDSVSSHQQ